MAEAVSDTTQLTLRLADGDAEARRLLVPRVYDELRALAAVHMSRERADHTLQPTALVHEVFLRLVNANQVTWQGRAQFISLAAQEIRKVLVDHARRRGAAKRGSNAQKRPLEVEVPAAPQPSVDILSLNEGLESLAERSPRQSRVVELRFFGGLTVAETANVLDVSERTVKDDWQAARAWLKQFMEG